MLPSSIILVLFIIIIINFCEKAESVRKENNIAKIQKELNVVISHDQIKKSPYYKEQVLQVPISPESGRELFAHWVDQAFSGLIASISTRRLDLVEDYDKKKHENCSSKAVDLVTHAKCFIELDNDSMKNRWYKRRKYFDKQKRINQIQLVRKEILPDKDKYISSVDQWIGSFKMERAKREIKVKSQATYSLKSEIERSPFAIVGKQLANMVKIFKKKNTIPRWQNVIDNIKEDATKLKKINTHDKMQRKKMMMYQKAAKNLQKNETLNKENLNRKRLPSDLRRLEDLIEDEDLREMFHDKAVNMTEEEKMGLIPLHIIRDATKLGMSMAGINTTKFDKKSVNLISPKFMSLVPDDDKTTSNEIDLLSPSLFALQDEGSSFEKNVSLRNILNNGMKTIESQQFIDALIELSGVGEVMEHAGEEVKKVLRQKDEAFGYGPEGQPLYFTKENVTQRYPQEAKKIEIFEKLDHMYTSQQLRDLNRTGYTILTPKQMDIVYGTGSPYENKPLIERVKNMTRTEINQEIHETIANISTRQLKFEVRQKDIVLTPLVLTAVVNAPAITSQPLILSPALFVPLIQSPAVFGAVILSPWAFVPVLAAPRILSPVILDPFIFVPIILSPLALDPVILAPGVFNPIILSPLLMDPFILSPQCMTPIILSPFCMTPLIVTPLALSPLILSPFVLSPQILSPQFVTAFILSPSAASPPVESKGILATAVLSPSLMS